MNIVIDQGNTFAKVGVFENNELIDSKSGLSDKELIDFVSSMNVKAICISSVSKQEIELVSLFADYCKTILVLNSSTDLPIQKRYETPQTLGNDRIAAAIGAKYIFPHHDCLVIDMGTCITYDLIDKDQNFEGGIISPGLRMRFKALNSFTKRLPLIESPNPSQDLIGKSTEKAMQSGVMNGILAEMSGFINQYQEIYPKCKVLLCGGDAQYFERRLKIPIFVSSSLVLIGLNHILNYYLKQKA